MSKLIFYYTVLGLFHRSRVFMGINMHMSFDCMYFACFLSFCVYTEKDIRRNWPKPPYVSLHLDQHPRELVCLKNGGINIIMLKKFLQFTKSVATMPV